MENGAANEVGLAGSGLRCKASGRCPCGTVTVVVALPKPLESLSPRRCDCDFCTERGLSYLSHPEGALLIESQKPFALLQQGSNQARFMACGQCGTLVAAVRQFAGGLRGALNAALLDERERLQEATTVSPKLLAAQEKLKRWEAVWLSVRVNGKPHLED